MGRFFGGALWGAIVGVLGLGVVSQLAPAPNGVVVDAQVTEPVAVPEPEIADQPAAPVSPEPAAEPEVVPEPIVAAEPMPAAVPPADAPEPADDTAAPPVVTAEVPEQAVMPEPTTTQVPRASEPPAAPTTPTAGLAQPQPDEPPVSTQAPAEPPAAPPSEAPMAQVAPDVPVAPTTPEADAPAGLATADSAAPASPGVDAPPAGAELPPPPPLTPEEQAMLDAATAGAVPLEPVDNPVLPVPDVVAEVAPTPEPETAAAPDPAPEPPETAFAPTGVIADEAPSTLAPTPPLGTDGAAIDRSAPEEAAEGVDPALDVTDESLPPLSRFAAVFENPDAKPLFSLVLIDDGAPDLDRAALAALPFPVSFALDPLAPGAADAAAVYRAGGKEVVMLATGIPQGATPADLEQTFQAHAAALPEAVAVIDLAEAGFQDDRPLATQLVPILAAQGRGLLTWDRGLNAADQVARREALPTAMVFRALDAEGEDTPVIRRYLDRAAFKAAQEGAVTVVGQTRPETVAALLEWAVEGRASTLALAPVSAVLAGQ